MRGRGKERPDAYELTNVCFGCWEWSSIVGLKKHQNTIQGWHPVGRGEGREARAYPGCKGCTAAKLLAYSRAFSQKWTPDRGEENGCKEEKSLFKCFMRSEEDMKPAIIENNSRFKKWQVLSTSLLRAVAREVSKTCCKLNLWSCSGSFS